VTAPPDGARVPVTVVVAAHNEADEIDACVRSVSWAAEVLVVENDSTDETVARARAAGATVFSHPFRSIGAQRNAAIDRAAHPWVLVIDADERATPALGAEVTRRIQSNAAEAYRIPRRNWFLGREIRHGGWDRDRPVRLFRSTLRYDERPVHEHVLTGTEPGTLDEPLLHTPYADLGEYFEKLGRYSRDWAQQNHDRGRKATMFMLVARPPARFFSTLFWRGGWRDGGHGVVIAMLAAMSVAAKYAQLWTLGHARRNGRDAGDAWPK
jgi:glycosyltransferase involved in cell wall biosynthesis